MVTATNPAPRSWIATFPLLGQLRMVAALLGQAGARVLPLERASAASAPTPL